MSSVERLCKLIQEHDKPWRDFEAMYIVLEDLNRNNGEAAKLLGCSPATVSKWKGELEIGSRVLIDKEEVSLECVRCERPETPPHPNNDLCDDCLDYIREEDSPYEWGREYPQKVRKA